MKYCEKCGAELFDDAVICTKCGRMTKATRAEKKVEPRLLVDKRPSTALAVFDFMFSLLVVMALFWMIESIAYGYVSSYGYFCLEPELAFFGFISALPVLPIGFVSFVMTLVGKHRGERLLSGIFKLAVGALLLIGAITLMNA